MVTKAEDIKPVKGFDIGDLENKLNSLSTQRDEIDNGDVGSTKDFDSESHYPINRADQQIEMSN